MIEITLGKRLKKSHNKAALYEADCEEFINFLRERTSRDIGTNYGIQSFMNFYPKPSLFIKSNENLPGRIHLSLEGMLLIDLFEMFPENMEMEQRRCPSPLVDYDDIYGSGRDLRRKLLQDQSKKQRKNTAFDCCNIC